MEAKTCRTCEALLPPDATFCPHCGAAASGGDGVPPPPPPQAPPEPIPGAPAAPASTGPDSDSRNLALLGHLSAFVMFVGIPSVVGPLVVWLIKRDQDPYVAAHALEALNFNLSLWLYGLVATILAVFTLGLALILIIPLGAVVAVAWFILVIVAAMRASQGEQYRYPLTLRLIR
jgi:uncharacterized protein